MPLTLITVNYNCAERTIRLLESLRRQTDGSTMLTAGNDFRIIIVDNASEETDRDRLRLYVLNAGAWTYYIQSEQNLGFSGGNNIGIKFALQNSAEWVLLINPDTWLEPDFISRLKPKLSEIEGIGAIPIQEGDKTAYCGRIKWLQATLLHAYDRTCHMMLEQAKNGYVIGAGLLLNSIVFKKIGFLDEKYFLYFEDADFSLRAHKAGIRIKALEEPVIHHEISGATKSLGSPLLLRYHWRNAHLFTWNHGPFWTKITLPFWSFWITIKQLVKIALSPTRRPESKAILAGIIDFYLRRFGKIN